MTAANDVVWSRVSPNCISLSLSLLWIILWIISHSAPNHFLQKYHLKHLKILFEKAVIIILQLPTHKTKGLATLISLKNPFINAVCTIRPRTWHLLIVLSHLNFRKGIFDYLDWLTVIKLTRIWSVHRVRHIFEPPHDTTNNVACAPSEDPDQPGHPHSLSRVFAVRSIGS